MMQSVRARVVLWVAEGDVGALPAEIIKLTSYGLEIRSCEDLRSYKKLIPQLRLGEREIIVTADDDVYYPRRWLSLLLAAHQNSPDAVICCRMHRITLSPSGVVNPYLKWDFDVRHLDPSPQNFPTGIGGVLYPPGALAPTTTDARHKELCPSADDIWFYFMARLRGTPIRRIEESLEFFCWSGSQQGGLWVENVIGEKNDRQFAAMVAEFGVVFDMKSIEREVKCL